MVKTPVNSSLIARDYFVPGSLIMELRTVDYLLQLGATKQCYLYTEPNIGTRKMAHK
jgi:hypothetical protein